MTSSSYGSINEIVVKSVEELEMEGFVTGSGHPLQELNSEWTQRAQEEVQEKGDWRERDVQALREMVNGRFESQ